MKPPKGWQELWAVIAEMREGVIAPVDTMGSSQLADKSLSKNEHAF